MMRYLTVSLMVGTAAMAAGAAPTFSKDVAAILNRRCVECHRPGEATPMSLMTYTDARPWARAIKAAVAARKMPPWFADPQYGHFKNERRLTDAELATLIAWVEAGAPEGNPADLPPFPKFVEGWSISKPDVILDIGQDFHVSKRGVGQYLTVTIDPHFTEDKWIQAGEVRPTNRAIVHHGNFMVIPPGQKGALVDGVRLNEVASKPLVTDPAKVAPTQPTTPIGFFANTLVNYAPGTPGQTFAPDTARLVKAGSKFQMDLHYTPTGRDEMDRTQIGLVFAKEPPRYQSLVGSVGVPDLVIPPGDPNYAARAVWNIPDDILIFNFFPHAHYRGKDFQYVAVYPDGREEVLLKSTYKFQWQIMYDLEKPIRVPKGSKIYVTTHWDNSVNNPDNPDPTAAVGWCEDSTCEMQGGFLTYIKTEQPIPPAIAPRVQ